MKLRSIIYLKYVSILKNGWNVHLIKNIFEKLQTAAGSKVKYAVQESGLWFLQQTWQACKLDIYYDNKILLWEKQIIFFEEVALL